MTTHVALYYAHLIAKCDRLLLAPRARRNRWVRGTLLAARAAHVDALMAAL